MRRFTDVEMSLEDFTEIQIVDRQLRTSVAGVPYEWDGDQEAWIEIVPVKTQRLGVDEQFMILHSEMGVGWLAEMLAGACEIDHEDVTCGDVASANIKLDDLKWIKARKLLEAAVKAIKEAEACPSIPPRDL